MRTLVVIVMTFVAMCLSGCARFAFYSKPDLTGTETGIKFYTPKPYLLVAHTGGTDKPTDISVIYIPDLANPIYAKPKIGIGSNNLTLTLSNGMLTQFGQQTDSKIPDLIKEIGGLATSLATASTTLRGPAVSRSLAAERTGEVANDLRGIAEDLRQQTSNAPDKAMTPGELQAANGIADVVDGAGKLLADSARAELNVPAVIVNLAVALDVWAKQIKAPSDASKGAELEFRRQLEALRQRTHAILLQLIPRATQERSFALYEIDNKSVPGTTTLKPVDFH